MVFELADPQELKQHEIIPRIYEEFADYMWAGDLEWRSLAANVAQDIATGDEFCLTKCLSSNKRAKVGVDVDKNRYQIFKELYMARCKRKKEKTAYKRLFLNNLNGCWQCELCGYTQNYLITKDTLPVIKEAWNQENEKRKLEPRKKLGDVTGLFETKDVREKMMRTEIGAANSLYEEKPMAGTGSVGSIGGGTDDTPPLKPAGSTMSDSGLMTSAILKPKREFTRPTTMKRKTADYLAYVWRQNSNFFSKDDREREDEDERDFYEEAANFDDLGCFPMCRVCLRHNCLGAEQRVFLGLARDTAEGQRQVMAERLHTRRGRDKTSLKADEQVSLLQNWIAHGAYAEGHNPHVHGYPRWMEEVWLLRRSFTTRKKIWWCVNDKCRYPCNDLESVTGLHVCAVCGMKKPRNNWEFWQCWRDMAQGLMPAKPLLYTNLPQTIMSNMAIQDEEVEGESIATR